MGVYLAKPETTKHNEDGGDIENGNTRFGMAAMQGWRQSMEDSHLAVPKVEELKQLVNADVSVYGVFDGHGGPAVSEWIARHMTEYIVNNIKSVEEDAKAKKITYPVSGGNLPEHIRHVCESLHRTFLDLDEGMQTDGNRSEIKTIHEEKKLLNESKGGDPKPASLLDAILCAGGEFDSPIIRILGGDGNKFFQIVSSYGKGEDGSQTTVTPLDDSEDSESKTDITIDFESDSEEDKRKTNPETKTTETETTDNKTSSENKPTTETTTKDSSSVDNKTTDSVSTTSQTSSTLPSDGSTGCSSAEYTPEEGDISLELVEEKPNSFTADPSTPENCGAAVILSMVVGGDQPYFITANAGDSRCVVCRNGIAVAMSEDHKPGLEREKMRISLAKGAVVNGRVDGNLNLSRTLGDLFYKRDKTLKAEDQKITGYPDVRVLPLCKADEFAILACDGIWDCVKNQEAVDFVKKRLDEAADPSKLSLSTIASELCDHCLADSPGGLDSGIGCDNMTCVIVHFGEHLKKVHTVPSENQVIFYGDLPDIIEIPDGKDDSENFSEDLTEVQKAVDDVISQSVAVSEDHSNEDFVQLAS